MAVKKILIEPNKILRQVSQPVNEVNKEIQKLLDDMLETMYSANGIGLAAIQIGIPKNLIVIDLLTKEKKKDQLVGRPVGCSTDGIKFLICLRA